MPDPQQAAGARRAGGFVCARALLLTGVPAVAAALFLVLGFGLSAYAGRPYIGQGLITAGLIAGAAAAGAAVGDLGWFLLAARDRPGPDEESAAGGHLD
ncbi:MULTISPECIES: hypothetical protein [unclassified Streptomyces]|uniref:hypothetical protein n=1 Tax=unclassified Streptomyces TaxID=2593676 RepID=UPI00224FB5B7|nr:MULTISPECIES: hypothetical protein [unclassified Streptomyces]MCX5048294.1 hypothetical protein [Streptomyces sp. NBC_00474]MCX5288064.1 hypothetical protein [Streptomyces sp. NBC_00183]